MNKLLITLFFTNICFATESRFFSDESGKSYEFFVNEEEKTFLSVSCKRGCLAKKALTQVTAKGVNPLLGQVPGLILCMDQVQGESVTLKNKRGGESSFCRFKDASMTESSRLYIHALKNDQKKK